MPLALVFALVAVLMWSASGPFFHFSDTWQLVINTATTIITFLKVFLIQNSQNRDAKSFHLKLDELLRSIKGARTSMVDLEELSEKDLERMQNEFRRLHEKLTAIAVSLALLAAATGQLPRATQTVRMARLRLLQESQASKCGDPPIPSPANGKGKAWK